jgi:hypothetical protein
MALTYDIKINGVRVDATIGVAIHDKLEEALDEGAINLPITTYDYPYKMLGLLTIEISDGIRPDINYNLLVINDSVSVMSKDGFYTHDISAIEYTHKLDKMFVSALSFTQPFLKQNRAPFRFFDASTLPQASNGYGQILPTVQFEENYINTENIIVPQVSSAWIFNPTTNTRFNTNVIITSNIPGNTANYNITAIAKTINISGLEGDYYIDVGFLDGSTFNPKYRHFIRIVKERRYTMWDVLQRIRAVIPIERESFFDATRIFDVDSSLQSSFESIEMPQLFFQKQTARQVLNTVFKYINAISRLQYNAGSRDTLTVDFFNKVGFSFNNNDIVEYDKVQNAQNYGSKAIAFLNNTIQSNFRENPSVKTPATNRFKTVRSNNVQLTQDSFELKLEKPIYELRKIEVMFPKVQFATESLVKEVTFNNYVLDITSRVLEKTFWDLKQSTVDILSYNEEEIFDEEVGMRLNKNGNIFWEKNSNSIKFNFIVGSIIKNNIIIESLQEALNEEFTLRLRDSDVFGTEFVLNDLPIVPLNPDFTTSGLTGFNSNLVFRNLKFNVEYVTLEDTVAQVDRLDISENNYDSYLKINNLEIISDYQRSLRDTFGKLERSAVPVKTIAKIHTDLSDVLKVGQIDSEGFIITERRLILHNEFIEAIYTTTKDHNRLNEFNGINQEYRVFETPSFGESLKRKDFYNDYIFLTTPSDTLNLNDVNNATLMDFALADRPFKHLFSNVPISNKITYAFVKTDGFNKVYPSVSFNHKAIMTPVISFGGKGGLNFTFGFESNQIVGDSIVKGGSNFFNNPIRYTDEQGFFDKLWFGLSDNFSTSGMVTPQIIGTSSETSFNTEYKYPLIENTNQVSLGQSFYFRNGSANSPDWFNVFKDSASSYGFAYHLGIIPLDYTKYVLGQSFYTENPLVYYTENQKTMYLYVYPTLTKYNKFDDLKIKSGWSNRYVMSTSVFTYNLGVFSFSGVLQTAVSNTLNWAIGDDEGNLFIASNTNANGFKILLRHLHPNLIQIGNK